MVEAKVVAEFPFPEFTYVPGRRPHPGHDWSTRLSGVAGEVTVEGLAQHPVFQFGIDLFQAGFYWEAHEAWELLWQRTGRHGPLADSLKGLIKLAAAGVKAREGRPNGVRRHGARAAELFELVLNEKPNESVPQSLPLAHFRDIARQIEATPEQWIRDGNEDVFPVFPWPLIDR